MSLPLHGLQGSPAPDSPFLNNSPAVPYASAFQAAPRQQPAYMSPALTQQFDGLTTASPLLLSANTLPTHEPMFDLTPIEETHVTVHEYGPPEGTHGSPITVKCHVHFPPSPPPSDASTSPDGAGSSSSSSSRGRAMRLVFGNHPVPTKVHILSANLSLGGQMCQLQANVPSWQSTGPVGLMGRSNRVPIHLQVLAGGSTVLETISVGEYTYTSINSKAPVYSNYTPAGNPLKRAGEALESHRPSPNHLLHRRAVSNNGIIKLESPDIPQYPQMQKTYDTAYASPYLAQGPAPTNDFNAPQPSLMRATQVVAPIPAAANPYILAGGNKASLELVGDLDAMAKGWTEDEWMGRRRLVQFWRRQDGTTISAAFRPLPQAEYPQQQQSIIISCIFREDKNACYVTSVDTIYLLEALVGTRFTVEEKNRIRRNLEGFRPITVSKNKAGSEEFFKTIMGFPNPKPRNIEKDVKVFPWEILGPALKKIIGKYSASYPFSSSGSASSTPILSDQAPLPPTNYGVNYSEPYSAISSGSVPTLASNSSSTSSYDPNYIPAPQTPQMSHPHSINPSPTDHFTRTPSEEKHHEYVNLSPTSHSPYAPTTLHHGRDSTGSTGGAFWPGSGSGAGIGVGTPTGLNLHSSEQALPSPAVSSGSYATLPGPGGYDQQPHQLPHVHETLSKQPSSSDLRVLFPGMAQ